MQTNGWSPRTGMMDDAICQANYDMGFFNLPSTTLLVTRRQLQQRRHRPFYTHVRSEEMIAVRIFALMRFLCLGTAAAATTQRNNDLSSITFGKWPFLPTVPTNSPQLTSSVALQPGGRRVRITVSTARTDKEVPSGTKSATAESAGVTTAITYPLIEESVWDVLSGEEFQQNPALVDALATTAIQVARNDIPDDWIDWQQNQQGNLDEGDICVWTGRSKNDACRGSKIPLIKTRSIIPLAANEMVDLMMDSTRVKTYNSWSIGRSDCWVHDDHTKIVQNRVQPPIGSKLVVSTALLHARPLEQGSWVIVTRAVKGFSPPEESVGVSEILLGVNLLEPIDDSSCRLTAVNHVYSSSIPLMLAERVGVKSAVNFVKDLRRLKEEGKL